MSEVIDNKANRIRVLKDIIKHLHAGNPPEQVQRQMREIVRQTDVFRNHGHGAGVDGRRHASGRGPIHVRPALASHARGAGPDSNPQDDCSGASGRYLPSRKRSIARCDCGDDETLSELQS